MRKIYKIFILIFLTMSISGSSLMADDLKGLTDKFYAGIADIVERNMNNPDRCLREVYKYYENNQGLINQIRKETEKAFAQMGPVIEEHLSKYASMSEEELEALEEKSMQEDNIEPQMSAAAKRYSQALEAFITKYPLQGSKIGMKAMELLPAFNVNVE